MLNCYQLKTIVRLLTFIEVIISMILLLWLEVVLTKKKPNNSTNSVLQKY